MNGTLLQISTGGVDRHVFKVPSLCNAEETGPYFQDGSVTAPDYAIRVMGRVLLHLASTTPTCEPSRHSSTA